MEASEEEESYSTEQKNLGMGQFTDKAEGKRIAKTLCFARDPYKNSKCLAKVCAVKHQKGRAFHQMDVENRGGLKDTRGGATQCRA